MNRLFPHIAKTLALLAVVLLPAEQLLASTCCCRSGQSDVKRLAVDLHENCCSKGQAGCCSTTDDSQRTCCEDGRSQPCQCPAGCFGQDAPIAVGPATNDTSSVDERTLSGILTIALDGADSTPSDSSSTTISCTATSGLQRCVLLCRFRL